MLKEILVVSGKPGLFKLISKGANLLIIESLIDQKRIPAYSRDKVISLGDISVYTDKEEVPLGEILTKIKEKENGCGKASIDLSKAQPDDLRNYFAGILPDFDREKVYPSDIKKILKWYELLIANGITDFLKVDEQSSAKESSEDKKDDIEEEKQAKSTQKGVSSSTTKRKESSGTALKKSPKATSKVQSAPKTSTPKKNVVGAKRGG